MFVVYPTRRYDFVQTLETKELDFSYSERNFAYEFTTNNDYFACKQKLLLYCYIIPWSCFPFCLLQFCISLATLKYPWIQNQNVFFQNKKFRKDSQSILCCMDKCNIFFNTNVLCLKFLHLNTLFCIILQYYQSTRKNLCQKKTNNTRSSCVIFFFVFYIGWT